MLSREIKKDPTCTHKVAVHATERPRLTLDSYFEKASGSGSAALTQMCMGVYYVFSMQNDVPIVSELQTPPWCARPLFKS